MAIITPSKTQPAYDVIIVGSGAGGGQAPELKYAKTNKQDVSVFDSRKFLTFSLTIIMIGEYPRPSLP